ncbi:hypothetical protein JIG36_41835 [Actinoplanes sp. LDG1-06]|uniref:Uncharacterized protein n=1 Tax=Paractinoplanes ovalisporus TaxID=2810368 RepID=A0ABS2AQE0_9ACTN|nr:hypothetical protein [Actinoplanes ovalisporus]MBM2622065.1 hypothetical protein [Actinoplanes ovalisporus]
MVWMRGLALAGVLWCAGLLVALALPGGLSWPMPVIVVTALLPILPGFVAVVVTGRNLPGSESGRRVDRARALWVLLRETLPGWLLAGSFLLFTGFWLVAVLSSVASEGVPEKRDGTYVVNNHGETTVISESEFQSLRTRDSRNLVAIAGGFGVGTVVLSTALLRRKAAEAVRLEE